MAGHPKNVILNTESVAAFQTWTSELLLTSDERKRYARDRDDRWVQKVFEKKRPLSVATSREYFLRFMSAVPKGHSRPLGDELPSNLPWFKELEKLAVELKPWSSISAADRDPTGLIDPSEYDNWARVLVTVGIGALGLKWNWRTAQKAQAMKAAFTEFLQLRAPNWAEQQWLREKLRYVGWISARHDSRRPVPFDPEYTKDRFSKSSRAAR